ncbi:sushi, von Willebrand factor type A, EGF and pentraxin domain-containing protein 1-like [Ruditapes philippinarum]|uniref:sushi, von Willebrand factor type A, EGF and pentraxin domain-containing protein 1-like n=1 Tax=Ruditapes philippinarum TaxID=129788 RepID=UPI00295AEDD9|nr:sushi, von Willebrand factor type A, EGF and pentraxin domain-containing protein 1-like [Ruditapes philippinarum]
MLIHRKLQSTWEVIATLYDDNKTFINSTSNFAKEITYSASVKEGATLSLFVNESDLTCEDQTLYQCHVEYNNKYGQCYSEEDKELRGFFFPNAITLVGRNNGSRIENSSRSYPAQMKVGDTLDLNCTANIGSDHNVKVLLLSTTLVSNGELIPTTGSLGAAIKGGDCQYMQSVTLSHAIDASDKSMGNISYLCQVEVITPDVTSKVIKSDVFFVEIYDQCPRPSTIENGKIVITGTSNGSKAELTCDQGYKRSTGFATCTSSGKWDTNMMCSKIDCKNLTIPLNGMVTYNSNTFFNDSAEITCNDGYSLKGQNSSYCQENGQWSITNNTCFLKRCAPLLPPNNGFINVNNYTTFVNDSVTFTCYPGYKLVGAAVTECSLDYTWTNAIPSCIIQNCTVPSAPSNGFYSLATESSVNSTASLTCKPGYRQFGNGTIQCLVNETWSETSANCTLIECPSPTAPDNGEVNIDNRNTEVNDTVTYSCNTGYKLSGTAQIKCDSNGSWDATPPTCILRSKFNNIRGSR